MTKEIAKDICGSIGEVNRQDHIYRRKGGCYISVRVTIDITKPLCRGRVVHLEEGGKCGLPSSMRDYQTFAVVLQAIPQSLML